MKKIYLAGPDVFARDAYGVADAHKALTLSYGFIPLYPLDNDVSSDDPEASLKIYEANLAKIHEADIVIANVNSFRGFEPDSGTVWEIGYAVALAKPVIGYIDNAQMMLERLKSAQPCTDENGDFFDATDQRIENFNLPLNLMLSHSMKAVVTGSLKDALQKAREL